MSYYALIRQWSGLFLEEADYHLASLPYRLGLRKGYRKLPVLVNGSPKTGTTWMLKLVASLPGYGVARGKNFSRNIERYRTVAPGQVVHGHDPFSDELWDILHGKGFKVIMMVRDPRDQTVSRMFHIRRDPNHAWHDRFKEMSTDDALMACIEGRPDGLVGISTLIQFTRRWVAEEGKSLPIRYEELLADTPHTFGRVLQFLGIDVAPDMVRSIVWRNRFERAAGLRNMRRPGQHSPRAHARKGIKGDWRNYFKAVHSQRFAELAGEALVALGYEQSGAWGLSDGNSAAADGPGVAVEPAAPGAKRGN